MDLRAIRRRTVSTAAVCLLLAGVVASEPAVAAAVSCGQTIMANTTLTADVGPCDGDGIIIGADNIRLNLNGHRIFGTEGAGDGNAAGIRLPFRTGVSIVGRAGGVRTMGVVSDFDAGVVINGGSANKVSILVIEDNVSHAEVDPPDSTEFTATLGDGIAVFNSAGNVIHGNIIRNNGIYDNIAILGVGSNDNVIQGNLITGAVGSVVSDTVGQGIVLTPSTNFPSPEPHESLYRNQILNNGISGNVALAISSIGNVDGVIQQNRILRNGFGLDEGDAPGGGIVLSSDPLGTPVTNVLVSNNVISGNAARGISQGNFDGDPTEGNEVVENTITKNGRLDPDSVFGRAAGGAESRRARTA